MAEVLKGAPVVAALNEKLITQVAELKAKDVFPTLAIVRVGQRDDDISYERGAVKRMEKIGIAVKQVVLPEDISEADLTQEIKALNSNQDVHGVLLFRPLPKHINEDRIRNTLTPDKDIDCITDLSLAAVFTDNNSGFAPCTAQACIEILDYYGIDIAGKRVVVVGRSLVIGKPVAMMLLKQNATVTICHSRSVDLPSICQGADILIACVGRAAMLDERYFCKGQYLIDVGINVTDDGKLIGDADFDAASKIVQGITPVPDGVGTVTTSVLGKHLVQAALRQSDKMC